MVDRLDVQLGKAPALPVVERRIGEVVGHERVIDLQIKTRIDDRLVLMAQRLGDGALHATRVPLAIVGLAGEPGLHQVEEIVRPRQAADVRYLYAGHFFFCISFQGSLTAVATVSSSTLASWPFTLRTSRRYSFCT